MRSRKETNWELQESAMSFRGVTYKTRDLMVQSCSLSLVSSSTKASSLEEERHFCARQRMIYPLPPTDLKVKPAQDALSSLFRVLTDFDCLGFEVNRDSDVAHW